MDRDPQRRGLAIVLLGRFGTDAVIPMLELALADVEPGIRLDAARGLARHPAEAADLREAQVLGAYAAAVASRERAELLGPLADVAATSSSPAFGSALGSEHAEERVAGCLALQRLASRGHAPQGVQLERVVELIENGAEPVASSCAAVLGEPVARETLPAPQRAQAARALERLARSVDPDVAVAGIGAFATLAERGAVPVLESLVGSREPRIALESVRALRRVASPSDLAKLAARELAGAAQPGTAAAQPGTAGLRAAALLELMTALGQRPEEPDAVAFAERALGRLAAPVPGASARATFEQGVLHCAAARLADAARHWPKELMACGNGQMPVRVRDAWVAEAFAGVEGSDELREAQLAKLFDSGSRPVQVAVLRAALSLPVQRIAVQLKRGLRSADPLVIAAACSAIAAKPELRALAEPDRVGVTDLLEAAPRVAGVPEAALAWLRAARSLARTPQGAITDAAGSTEHAAPAPRLISATPALIERVTGLARQPTFAVRDSARALLAEWDAPVPAEHEPVRDALPADRLPAPSQVFHVKLSTTAGPIVLELDVAHAPVAAVRFVELARSGALDGLPVAELSAGHAVAFAPSPSAEHPALRHEDTYAMIERGSVLLQDHGRDGVGPGFALILSRAPNLDRRAVRLGAIREGLEVADKLLPADSILEAQVSIANR